MIKNKPPEEHGFIFTRREDGSLITNVPHLVTVHSPTGYEIGYGGSGPADLALNICEYVLRQLGYDGPCEKGFQDQGRYFLAAWAMHQEFKWKFLAGLNRDGSTIGWQRVKEWVWNKLVEYNASLQDDPANQLGEWWGDGYPMDFGDR